MRVEISLDGCDDGTVILLEEVDTAQLEFLEKIAALSRENSKYACQPKMKVKELQG